jgi:hypothetical protein
MSTNKHVYIGKVKLPTSFSPSIVTRMFEGDSDGLERFLVKYSESKISEFRGKTRQKPSDAEFAIATRYKNGEKVLAIARSLGYSKSRINSIIDRVSVWKMLHS